MTLYLLLILCCLQVNGNVSGGYSAHKEFFLTFMKVVITECVLRYFEMDDKMDSPTNVVPPKDPEERLLWTQKQFANIVRSNVGLFVYRKGM